MDNPLGGNSLGNLVRQLRTARGLSLRALARLAGVTQPTLGAWERGTHVPRVPELDAVLTALDVSMQQRERAYELLSAPGAVRHIRAQERELCSRSDRALVPLPTCGDLLRAIRLRNGKTLEEVSRLMGVNVSTLSRWERGAARPDNDQLQWLCYLMQAREAELTALTLGRMRLPCAEEEPATADTLWRRYWSLESGQRDPSDEGLKDLNYLTLITDLRPLAARDRRARGTLADLYAVYALFLVHYRR